MGRSGVEPTEAPSELDFAWTAGFLEGEGSFIVNRGYVRIQASQVDREPLERLQRLYGGSIQVNGGPSRPTSSRTRNGFSIRQTLWYWSLYGEKAEGLLDSIAPMMSHRRRVAIENVRANATRPSGRKEASV